MKRAMVLALAALCALWGVFALAEGDEELPSLLLVREVSSSYADAGDWVTLSYTLSNTTAYAITELTLTDSLLGEVAHIDRLESGEKKVITTRVRITGDCESVPVAKYTLGGRSRTRYLLALPIRIERAAYSAVLEQADNVIRLTVINEGNGPLSAIRASEPLLGDMGGTVNALEPGESAVFERAARAGSYTCTVTAVTAAGKSVSFESNQLDVFDTAVVRAAGEGLSLSAQQERSGQIVVTLTNPGPGILTDVTLTELNSGMTRTLAVVPVGSGMQVLWTDAEDGQTAFVFQAAYGGASLTAVLNARAQAEESSSLIDDTGVPAVDGASYKMVENPHTYRQMMLLAAAALVAVIWLWWLSAQRRRRLARKKKQQKRARQRQAKERKATA